MNPLDTHYGSAFARSEGSGVLKHGARASRHPGRDLPDFFDDTLTQEAMRKVHVNRVHFRRNTSALPELARHADELWAMAQVALGEDNDYVVKKPAPVKQWSTKDLGVVNKRTPVKEDSTENPCVKKKDPFTRFRLGRRPASALPELVLPHEELAPLSREAMGDDDDVFNPFVGNIYFGCPEEDADKPGALGIDSRTSPITTCASFGQIVPRRFFPDDEDDNVETSEFSSVSASGGQATATNVQDSEKLSRPVFCRRLPIFERIAPSSPSFADLTASSIHSSPLPTTPIRLEQPRLMRRNAICETMFPKVSSVDLLLTEDDEPPSSSHVGDECLALSVSAEYQRNLSPSLRVAMFDVTPDEMPHVTENAQRISVHMIPECPHANDAAPFQPTIWDRRESSSSVTRANLVQKILCQISEEVEDDQCVRKDEFETETSTEGSEATSCADDVPCEVLFPRSAEQLEADCFSRPSSRRFYQSFKIRNCAIPIRDHTGFSSQVVIEDYDGSIYSYDEEDSSTWGDSWQDYQEELGSDDDVHSLSHSCSSLEEDPDETVEILQSMSDAQLCSVCSYLDISVGGVSRPTLVWLAAGGLVRLAGGYVSIDESEM